jgi:hypothetical protein
MCATIILAALFRLRHEHNAARVAGEPVQAPHTQSEVSRVCGRSIDYVEDRAVGHIELPVPRACPYSPAGLVPVPAAFFTPYCFFRSTVNVLPDVSLHRISAPLLRITQTKLSPFVEVNTTVLQSDFTV